MARYSKITVDLHKATVESIEVLQLDAKKSKTDIVNEAVQLYASVIKKLKKEHNALLILDSRDNRIKVV